MKSTSGIGLLAVTAGATETVASGSRVVKTGAEGFLALFGQIMGGKGNREAARNSVVKDGAADYQTEKTVVAGKPIAVGTSQKKEASPQSSRQLGLKTFGQAAAVVETIPAKTRKASGKSTPPCGSRGSSLYVPTKGAREASNVAEEELAAEAVGVAVTAHSKASRVEETRSPSRLPVKVSSNESNESKIAGKDEPVAVSLRDRVLSHVRVLRHSMAAPVVSNTRSTERKMPQNTVKGGIVSSRSESTPSQKTQIKVTATDSQRGKPLIADATQSGSGRASQVAPVGGKIPKDGTSRIESPSSVVRETDESEVAPDRHVGKARGSGLDRASHVRVQVGSSRILESIRKTQLSPTQDAPNTIQRFSTIATDDRTATQPYSPVAQPSSRSRAMMGGQSSKGPVAGLETTNTKFISQQDVELQQRDRTTSEAVRPGKDNPRPVETRARVAVSDDMVRVAPKVKPELAFHKAESRIRNHHTTETASPRFSGTGSERKAENTAQRSVNPKAQVVSEARVTERPARVVATRNRSTPRATGAGLRQDSNGTIGSQPSRVRGSDNAVEKFWQERLVSGRSLGNRMTIMPSAVRESVDARSAAETSLPKMAARTETAVSMKSIASVQNEPSAPPQTVVSDDVPAQKRTIYSSSVMSGKSLWGVRIGSGDSAVKMKTAPPHSAIINPAETKRKAAPRIQDTRNPAVFTRDESQPKSAGRKESVPEKNDLPKPVASHKTASRAADVTSTREGEELRPSPTKVFAANETSDVKQRSVPRGETTGKTPNAMTATGGQRASQVTNTLRSQTIESGRSHAIIPESERTSVRASATRVERTPPAARLNPSQAPVPNRSETTSSDPKRVSLDGQTRPLFKSDASRISAKSAVQAETPVSTAAARTNSDMPATTVSGTQSTFGVNRETVWKGAEFSAPTRRDASIFARSGETIRKVPEQPAVRASESSAGHSTSAERVATPENRSSPSNQPEAGKHDIRFTAKPGGLTAEARASQIAGGAETAPEKPKPSVNNEAQTKNTVVPSQPRVIESRITRNSPNRRESATILRGETQPEQQTETSGSGQSKAEPAGGKETAALNVKEAVLARAPIPNPMPAKPKTPFTEPRKTAKPAPTVSTRQAEPFRSPIQNTMTDVSKTLPVEPRKPVKPNAPSSPATVPAQGEESQKTTSRSAGERNSAPGQTIQTASRPTAATIPLSTAPHRPRLSAEQVRELQTMVARSVQNARTSISGKSTTRFSLQHATLGALQFRVTTRRDNVAIEISSASRETTETLEEGRPAVERAIADLGMRVERFEIRLRDSSPVYDPMNHGFETDREPPRDHAAGSPEDGWGDGGVHLDDVENMPARRPLLAEHEWVA